MEDKTLAKQNPYAFLAQMAGGYCLSRILHTITNIGVADVLNAEPKTVDELAMATEVHPETLDRMLRLLASHGVFEVEGDMFGHSDISRLLRKDHPQSMNSFVQMFGLPAFWKTYGELGHTLKTGLPAADKAMPGGLWQYFGENIDESDVFNAAMASKSTAQVPSIVSAYDFSSFKSIVDIGGGQGHLLSKILKANTDSSGILFDLPHVIDQVTDLPSGRLTTMAGNFFKDDLPVCDAYILMEIIHDWADEEALTLLKAVRKVAPDHAKVLIIEQTVPESSDPHWSKIVDIHMLALVGGKQRSRKEYIELLERAGLSFKREVKTFTYFSIIEADI